MTASSINIIHLYRNLLREASYLIDTNSQSHVRALITSSFRTKISTPPHIFQKQRDEQYIRVPSLDIQYRLKRGRKYLSLLQRANQGHVRPLTNVLKLTYARKGRLRRERMQEYMAKEPINNETAKSDAAIAIRFPTRKATASQQDWKPSSKFIALMRSQQMVQSHLDSRTTMKLKPVIPALNRAGRPMPACRIKNITKSWYKKTAQILQPHLNSQEYEVLKMKATGENLLVNRKRRKLAAVRVFSTQSPAEQDEELSRICDELIQGPEKRRSRRQRREMGNPHKMTKRFLGRIYTRVLRQTPSEVPSLDTSKLAFSWDDGIKKLPRIVHPSSDAQVRVLFEP